MGFAQNLAAEDWTMASKGRKAYAGVSCRYYKQEAAVLALDHSNALRQGITKSSNVFTDQTTNNFGYYYHGASSCLEALDLMKQKHKHITGKKVRSDNNVLFEHVVFFSEFRIAQLEKKYGSKKVKIAIAKRMNKYARSVKREFGFEPLGFDAHLDEGRIENGKFIRNYHIHLQMFNYSFEKRLAPLRHMMKKGKNDKGQTKSLNPNFEKLQDLVHQAFGDIGFNRGESKDITGRKHLNKEEFVKEKRKNIEIEVADLSMKNEELKIEVKRKLAENLDLTNKIHSQEKTMSWLEEQIDNLKRTQAHLSKAIKTKSQNAIRMIMRKSVVKESNSFRP